MASRNPESDSKITVADKRKHPFTMIDDVVMRDYGCRIGTTGLAIYVTLLRYAKLPEGAHPKIRTLADELGASENTIRTGIKLLEKQGLIRAEPRKLPDGRCTSSKYEILPVKPVKGDPENQDVPESAVDPDYPSNFEGCPPSNIEGPYPSEIGRVPLQNLNPIEIEERETEVLIETEESKDTRVVNAARVVNDACVADVEPDDKTAVVTAVANDPSAPPPAVLWEADALIGTLANHHGNPPLLAEWTARLLNDSPNRSGFERIWKRAAEFDQGGTYYGMQFAVLNQLWYSRTKDKPARWFVASVWPVMNAYENGPPQSSDDIGVYDEDETTKWLDALWQRHRSNPKVLADHSSTVLNDRHSLPWHERLWTLAQQVKKSSGHTSGTEHLMTLLEQALTRTAPQDDVEDPRAWFTSKAMEYFDGIGIKYR